MARSVRPTRSRLHADRAIGGDRDHRDAHRPTATRGTKGPRGRRPDEVPEQPQADRPRHPRSKAQRRPAAGLYGTPPGTASATPPPTSGGTVLRDVRSAAAVRRAGEPVPPDRRVNARPAVDRPAPIDDPDPRWWRCHAATGKLPQYKVKTFVCPSDSVDSITPTAPGTGTPYTTSGVLAFRWLSPTPGNPNSADRDHRLLRHGWRRPAGGRTTPPWRAGSAAVPAERIGIRAAGPMYTQSKVPVIGMSDGSSEHDHVRRVLRRDEPRQPELRPAVDQRRAACPWPGASPRSMSPVGSRTVDPVATHLMAQQQPLRDRERRPDGGLVGSRSTGRTLGPSPATLRSGRRDARERRGVLTPARWGD